MSQKVHYSVLVLGCFVVSRAVEAHDARARGPNRKFWLKGERCSGEAVQVQRASSG